MGASQQQQMSSTRGRIALYDALLSSHNTSHHQYVIHKKKKWVLDFHIESNLLALGGVGTDNVTNPENRYFCNHVNLLLLKGGGPLLIMIWDCPSLNALWMSEKMRKKASMTLWKEEEYKAHSSGWACWCIWCLSAGIVYRGLHQWATAASIKISFHAILRS